MLMRWNSHEIADKILRRAELIDRRDAKTKKMLYTALSAVACLVLIVFLSFSMLTALPEFVVTDVGGLYSATLFGDGTAGGYILIGVLGFVLGATVMYLSLGHTRKGKGKDHEP